MLDTFYKVQLVQIPVQLINFLIIEKLYFHTYCITWWVRNTGIQGPCENFGVYWRPGNSVLFRVTGYGEKYMELLGRQGARNMINARGLQTSIWHPPAKQLCYASRAHRTGKIVFLDAGELRQFAHLPAEKICHASRGVCSVRNNAHFYFANPLRKMKGCAPCGK